MVQMNNTKQTSDTTVAVERVSNSGNPIAREKVNGKAIHVPAGAVGETYEVRLIDKGGYFVAKLVDQTKETQPRSPSIGPSKTELDTDLLHNNEDDSHSFEIRDCPGNGDLRTLPNDDEKKSRLKRMARRKK